jgi:mannose-6-phosphate isomerase class I
MKYTQDESYYMMEAKPGAVVYLGLKKGIDKYAMIADLQTAQKGEQLFDADKYVNAFPVKKHDHVSIPAGTIHCSGADSVVLEISATPYIFTFKLWDWGRMGLDGKPRPINIEHGKNVIQWNRDADWAQQHAVNLVEKVEEGDGYTEEKTGLNERQFIETRRHWFTKKVTHHTNGSVNVLNLVEGDAIIVESPENKFDPFTVHYAETFIVPAFVQTYTIRPFHKNGKQHATIKAYIRG